MKPIYLLLCALMPLGAWAQSQPLQPGFDTTEYAELLLISVKSTADTAYMKRFEAPKRFKMIYQSQPVGLDNLWDLWTDGMGTAVISIRGTTPKTESWLANFYAAMIPAQGRLVLSKGDTFTYRLANHPQAAVHTGWTISLASMRKDMEGKLDSLYAQGGRHVIIMGHSQGGGIAYLLTAWVLGQQEAGRWEGLQFKTYCSAAPKPGNLFFAYDYEQRTAGWAFNVVSPLDWVPQSPVSVQTLDDFTARNPFTNAKAVIAQQPFPTNWALRYVFNKLDGSTRHAEESIEKYMGRKLEAEIQKTLPEFVAPTYVPTANYVRTGATLVLRNPDEAYHARFPESNDNVFLHHLHDAYGFLIIKP